MKIDSKSAAIAAVTIVLAGISVLFTGLGFSDGGLHDAEYFMPAAINYAAGRGLTNPVTRAVAGIGDPSGASRFLSYPPLFPIVVGWFLGPRPNVSYPQQTFIVAGIMNAVAVILGSWILWRVATLGGRKLDWAAAAFICLALVVMLRPSLKFAGRPETLARLFMSLGLLLMLYPRSFKISAVVFAALFALAFAAYPVALFFAAVMGLFFSFREENALPKTALAYLLAALIFLLVMQISPFGIRDTLAGTLRHGEAKFSPFGSAERAWALLKNPYWAFYGILIASLIFAGAQFYVRRRKDIKSPFLFACFAVSAAWFLVYFLILESRTYYVNALSIFMFAALAYYLFHVARTGQARGGALAFMAFASLFSLQAVILFPFFVKNGVGIAEAREKFRESAAAYPDRKILVTLYGWVVFDDYGRMVRVDDVGPAEMRRSLVVLDQTWANSVDAPATFRGCPLRTDYFVDKIPKVSGIPLARVTPGYGFALYDCR